MKLAVTAAGEAYTAKHAGNLGLSRLLDDQPVPEVQIVFVAQMTKATLPCSHLEIAPKSSQALFYVRQINKPGHAGARASIKVGVWATPVGPQEPVRAVPGYGNGLYSDTTQLA